MARTNLTFDRTKQRALPIWLLILAVLLIVARIVSKQYPEKAEHDLVRWMPISQAIGIARTTHRPVFYEFSAAWCGPCKMLEREVFMDEDLAKRINDRFIAVKVVDTKQEEGRNWPDVQALMDRYSVNAFPTIVIAGPDGSVLDRVVGYPGAGKMAAMIDRPR
jgi:thiol:disulfide interchange protein